MEYILISGGLSSAYCAKLVLDRNPAAEMIFNDTRWEHEDLYRFLRDIEKYFGKKIIHVSDGRTPEDVFYDIGFLGSNRVPVCSRILKAEQTRKFVEAGDILNFGIGANEAHRATRIKAVYDSLNVYSKFPLLENVISDSTIKDFFSGIGIEIPQMYKDGFSHNNCSGGCVRAGKTQWLHLLKTYPNVYRERERESKRNFRNLSVAACLT